MWFTRLLLFILISVESLVSSQDDNNSLAEKRGGKKYCGPNLSNTLRLVCAGLYNSMFNKKSDPDMTFDWMREPEQLDSTEEIEYVFQPKSHAQALIPRDNSIFRRHIRGAYDECCRKTCSLTEMSSYCANKA